MRLTNAIIMKIRDNAIKTAGLFKLEKQAEENLLLFGASIAANSFGELAEEAAKSRSEYARFYSQLSDELKKSYPSTPWSLTNAIRCNFAGCRKTFFLKDDVPFNAAHTFAYPSDHHLTIQWRELEHELELVQKRINELGTEVSAFCKSFTTVGRLVKAWPEVEKLMPPLDEFKKAKALVVQPSELNKKLELK